MARIELSFNQIERVRHGIRITVCRQGQTWTTYFNNEPGNFDQLHRVRAIRGTATAKLAMELGEKFVDDHQWKTVEKIRVFVLSVRLWWDGRWGYGLWCEGSGGNSDAVYLSAQAAIEAGRQKAKEEIEQLDQYILEDDRRRAERKARLAGKPAGT